MSASAGQNRFWLLNHFGRFLELDLMRDCLFSRTLDSTAYPGIFFFADDPHAGRADVELRKAVSLPMPFPPLTLLPQASGLVAFETRDTDEPRYMRSLLDRHLDFNAAAIREWELYLPVDEEHLHAFILLGQPALTSIHDTGGHALSPLELKDNFQVVFGKIALPLLPNFQAFAEIAHLVPGTETALELTDGKAAVSLVVTRH